MRIGTGTIGVLLALVILGSEGPGRERNVTMTMDDLRIRPADGTAVPKPVLPIPATSRSAEAPTPSAAQASPAPADRVTSPPAKGKVPGNAMNFESPSIRLYNLIQEAMGALYRAPTDVEFQELVAKLRKTLATDTTLPEDVLTTEKKRFLDQLADVHTREPRVYPAPQTLKVWNGILRAIDEALADRRASGSVSPLP